MDKEIKKIVVLHGTNYWNMGDLGLVYALLENLNREFPYAEIKLLSIFHNEDRTQEQEINFAEFNAEEKPFLTISKENKLNKFLRLFRLLSLFLLNYCYMLILKFFVNNTEKEDGFGKDSAVYDLLSCDIIISKPGGFLNGTAIVPAINHVAQLFLAIKSSRPTVIYAQSIGPITSKIGKKIVAYILNRIDMILVRDVPSLEFCRKKLHLNGNISLTYDEAFTLGSKEKSEGAQVIKELGVDTDKMIVGVTALDWGFPYSDNPKLDKENYLNNLSEFLDRIIEEKNSEIILFTFLIENNFYYSDVSFTEKIKDNCKNSEAINICKLKDPYLIKAVMKNVDMFVGSRMHSNIFALSLKIPVVAIAYLPKTIGIMEMFGLEEFVIPIEKIKADMIEEKLQLLIDNKGGYVKKLEKNMRSKIYNKRSNTDYLKDVI